MLNSEGLTINEKTSILYHNLFDYPLNLADLIRWTSGKQTLPNSSSVSILNKRGYYFMEGREGLIYKRILRKRISAKKMKMARKISKILSFVPGIKMIGITGSLAMENSAEEGDIDLMMVARRGNLWTTRLTVYLLINLLGIQKRSPKDKTQKDKACLNMWFDESDLVWSEKNRNMYTAHEIAQIIPLVNKDKTYEKFLFENRWILSFWPKAVKIKQIKNKVTK